MLDTIGLLLTFLLNHIHQILSLLLPILYGITESHIQLKFTHAHTSPIILIIQESLEDVQF